MDHRNGRAPVALARDEPVAQLVTDRPFAAAAGFQLVTDAVGGNGRGQSVKGAGVYQPAVACETDVVGWGRFRGPDDGDYRQFVRSGKSVIPLVVGRHAHDRTAPVSG